MNKVRYERAIDKIYDNMTMEKQGQLIDSINNVLMNARQPVHLNENITDKELKEFLYEYVRTDDEVFEEDIEHFDIRCPVEFLDKDAMISMDNDYDDLIDDLHLNTFAIYECDYEELTDDKILIEFKKNDKNK